MEYIYERNPLNDQRKRQADVAEERAVSIAFDTYASVSEKAWSVRLETMLYHMNEAMASIPTELLDESILLQSQQPPLNFRRPTLTPPVVGYEPGFGLDVPQLRAQQQEYPAVTRPTDAVEFGGSATTTTGSTFPFIDTEQLDRVVNTAKAAQETQLGAIRSRAPTTGVEGEAWEAYCALNAKALARQKLILDLASNETFREEYNKGTEEEWEAERFRRGMLPLEIEPEYSSAELDQVHYAQTPTYQPFRK